MEYKNKSVAERILSACKVLLYVILFFGVQFAVSTIFSVYALIKTAGLSESEALDAYNKLISEGTNVIIFFSNLLAIGVVFLIYIGNNAKGREGSVSFSEYFSFRKIKPSLAAVALATGIMLNFALNFIMTFIPQSWLDDYSSAASSLSEGSVVFYILGAAIMAPIAEEIFFRALAIKELKNSVSPVLAVLLSSAVFGMGHGQILWIAYAALLGVLFGFVYEKTGSVFTSICMHLGFNGINVVFLILNKIFRLSEVVTYIMEFGYENAPYTSTQVAVATVYQITFVILLLASIPLSVLGLVYIFKRPRKKSDTVLCVTETDADTCPEIKENNDKDE